MKRVVVTGNGHRSRRSVTTRRKCSLLRRERNPASCAPDKYAELGLPLPGARRAPPLDPSESVDRRAMRFLGGRRRLEPRRHGAGDPRRRPPKRPTFPMSAPASSWARAGRRPAPSLRARILRAAKVPSASDRSRSRKRCRRQPRDASRPGSRSRASTIRSPRPARLPTTASAMPTRPFRSASRTRSLPALRGARLDTFGAVRCHGRDVVGLQSDAGQSLACLRQGSRRLSSSPAAPACWCSKNSITLRRAVQKSSRKLPVTARLRRRRHGGALRRSAHALA